VAAPAIRMVGAGLHGEDHEQNLHWSSFTEAAVRHVPCNQSNEAGAPGEQVSKEASGRSFRIAAGGDPGCGSARQPSSGKIERIHSRSVCKHLASRRLQCMAPNLLTLPRQACRAARRDTLGKALSAAGQRVGCTCRRYRSRTASPSPPGAAISGGLVPARQTETG
jgi:hypothetical protein